MHGLRTGGALRRSPRPAMGVPVVLVSAFTAALLAAPPAASAASAASATAEGDRADTLTFPAPAQQAIVDFTAPLQRAPDLLDTSAADSSEEETPPPGGGPASTVAELTDPAAGLGPVTAGRIPDDSTQVLIASGADDDSSQTRLSLWEWADDAWTRTASMAGHNGGNGWKEDRREGDETSPAGVFSLSDAGGYLTDPGSLLPYHRDEGLRSGAESVYGDGYASVFDYVIAIDYNRKTGVAPTENTRPMGWDAGGKIWLHVEHGNPTRGCVALPEEDMELLLTTLDPDRSPHIAMGSEEYLAQ
ncbi:L,D-transpeptidase family protein [Brevibacterium jeotgali]|uniref:L,D-TPase catalytic domain-containing protein n=1 Tax=Brevibacterium jeotgali TaxID=1262550 RepID=A0A2H1L6T8_9MICO|nr:L,D-transpeptidase family protein [Brevibacterium jeotgali]TWC02698.1 hypothetical protein FB108_1381 [Brevibacterium jeotgali]SMY12608.1 hypothetical protein BJEO58_02206 [Brevibacterium jeotgali]